MQKKTMIWLGSLTAAAVFCGALAVSAQPGDNSDPVVTKSYIDQVVSELRSYVDSSVQNTSSSSQAETPPTSGVSSTYQVLEIAQGQKVTLGEGTEFILRGGKGTIFSTPEGGIADTTAGEDLADGSAVPLNHLLIVPRNDGRGFVAEEDSFLMIRGSYQIQ